MPNSNGTFSQPIPFFRFLDSVGNGSGSKTMVANFSGAATSYKMIVPAGKIYIATQFVIHISGAGSYSATNFGGIATLTNGILLNIRMNGVVGSLLDNVAIKDNSTFYHMSPQLMQIINLAGATSVLVAQYNPSDFGLPATLNGDTGDYIEAVLHDDFSLLGTFDMHVKGYV